jgi:hypothetical protein
MQDKLSKSVFNTHWYFNVRRSGRVAEVNGSPVIFCLFLCLSCEHSDEGGFIVGRVKTHTYF